MSSSFLQFVDIWLPFDYDLICTSVFTLRLRPIPAPLFHVVFSELESTGVFVLQDVLYPSGLSLPGSSWMVGFHSLRGAFLALEHCSCPLRLNIPHEALMLGVTPNPEHRASSQFHGLCQIISAFRGPLKRMSHVFSGRSASPAAAGGDFCCVVSLLLLYFRLTSFHLGSVSVALLFGRRCSSPRLCDSVVVIELASVTSVSTDFKFSSNHWSDKTNV